MKKNILLIFLMLMGISCFAQKGPELKGYFGFSGTLLGPNAGVIGSGSAEMDGFREFGLMLSAGIGGKFRLNTGFSYAYG